MESNFFAVKDKKAFNRFCVRWDLASVTNSEGLSGFYEPEDKWGRMRDSESDDYGLEEVEEADSNDSFVHELADQLAEHYVAVVQDTENEHYPRGDGAEVFAVNSKHETAEITLSTIFSLAAHLGHYVVEEMAF